MSPARLSPDHPAPAGIGTPALVVDKSILRANIARMADFAGNARIALRPHAKTHKSAAIAMLQAGGIGDLLLASPVADAARAASVRSIALQRWPSSSTIRRRSTCWARRSAPMAGR